MQPMHLSTIPFLLVALIFCDAAVAMKEATVGVKAQGLVLMPTRATADIRFTSPKLYAVVEYRPGTGRRIYTAGDVLFHPRRRTIAVRIERIDFSSIVLRGRHSPEERRVYVGEQVAGFPGVLLARIVLLDQLQYRFLVVDHVKHEEPVLVSIVGSQAVLEKEVLPPVPHDS